MCGIWTFSLVLMIPYLIVYDIHNSFCTPTWPSPTLETIYFLAGSLLFCYSIPLALIITCYCLIGYKVWHRKAPGVYGSNGIIHRSKIKVVKMLVVVVVLFAASWFPLWVVHIKLRLDPHPTDIFTLFNYVIPICQWLGCANSSINPIIYSLFSRKIRMKIKAILLCRNAEYETPRHLSSYASTRYVSVDYTNGHVTLRTNGSQKERKSSRTDRLFNNVYDWFLFIAVPTSVKLLMHKTINFPIRFSVLVVFVVGRENCFVLVYIKHESKISRGKSNCLLRPFYEKHSILTFFVILSQKTICVTKSHNNH